MILKPGELAVVLDTCCSHTNYQNELPCVQPRGHHDLYPLTSCHHQVLTGTVSAAALSPEGIVCLQQFHHNNSPVAKETPGCWTIETKGDTGCGISTGLRGVVSSQGSPWLPDYYYETA